MTPTHLLTIALDLAIVLLATMRLIRFVVTDSLGTTLIWRPLIRIRSARGFITELLSCPFCIGFWLGGAVLLSLALIGGPGADGTAAVVWRYVAGAFALNWVAAHIGSRMGDAGYADDESEDER